MNTPVKFEIAKLLKEKGFDELLNYYYDSFGDIGSSKVKVNWNESEELLRSAPTIAEVVIWLYENHGIWIGLTHQHNKFFWSFGSYQTKEFNTPTEAYDAAILFALKNLI
jgi:hypothetical protein